MNGLEFADKLIGHVVALLTGFAWPGVVIVLFYTQRASLAKVIKTLDLKSIKGPGGFAMEFRESMKDATAAIAEVKADVVGEAKIELKAPVGHAVGVVEQANAQVSADAEVIRADAKDELVNRRVSEVILSYLSNSPGVVIDNAWKTVRQALYRFINDDGAKAASPLEEIRDVQLVVGAANAGHLDPRLVQAIQQLMSMHSGLMTSYGWVPTHEEAIDYVRNSFEVVGLLESWRSTVMPKRK